MMLLRLLLLLAFNSILLIATAEEIVLSGYYYGTSLYVQNPPSAAGGFCIKEIYVNDKKINFTDATAVDIKMEGVKVNDPVKIRIVHKNDCEPKVMNPNAIRLKTSFQFTSTTTNESTIEWITKGEKKFSQYFIERLEQTTWNTIATINTKGLTEVASYSHPITHNSGFNRYRIKYLEATGKFFYSPEIAYQSNVKPVEFFPLRVNEKLKFTREVSYEILDAFGTLIKKGTGTEVDCTNIKTGTYYVVFDNRTEKFFKK